jgi:hypothetical protein
MRVSIEKIDITNQNKLIKEKVKKIKVMLNGKQK